MVVLSCKCQIFVRAKYIVHCMILCKLLIYTPDGGLKQ